MMHLGEIDLRREGKDTVLYFNPEQVKKLIAFLAAPHEDEPGEWLHILVSYAPHDFK